MKRIKLLDIAFAALLMAGCNTNEPILFDSSMNFLAFSASSVNVSENLGAVNTPIVLGATAGSPQTTVTVEVSNDGLSSPAIEGTDYTLESKQVATVDGVAQVTIIPIDNEDFTGDKSFYVTIVSNSQGYNNGSKKQLLVVLKDNEHPLGKWIGQYVVAAASYGSPGAWDEEWFVTTEPDPDDVNNLIITGIGGDGSAPSVYQSITGVVNLDDMTITLAPGQTIGDVYGYGNIAVYKGTDTGDDLVLDAPLIGIIEEDGTILVDLWGHLIVEGDYTGYFWDVFNTTWTKQ
jgi:hypothetical protein